MSNIVKENVLAIINSDYRLNPSKSTTSNFTYSFNDKIDRIEEITVKNVQIPYTFYVFKSATHNVLTFNSGAYQITIPDGNYSIATLTPLLTSLINAAFGDSTTVVTFSKSNYKLTISRGTLFNVDAAVSIPASTASNLLGFTFSSITSLSVTGDGLYNISGKVFNNTNTLTFNNGAITAVIPPGNYASSSLTNILISSINAAFGDSSTNAIFSNNTYKLTISRATAFILDSTNTVPQSTASLNLGFNKTTPILTTVVSDGICNISGPNYLLVRSVFLTQAANRKTIFANNTYSNVLAVIPVVVSNGDVISIPDTGLISIHMSYKFTILETDIIDISITDEDGAPLELNNASVSIQLIFITE